MLVGGIWPPTSKPFLRTSNIRSSECFEHIEWFLHPLHSPIWSLSSSASWWHFHALSCFSERSSSLPDSYLSVSSDSVESLLLAKAISYFQELLHLNRCVATAFRIILRASGFKVTLSNSYSKSMGADFEREMKISKKIFFILPLEWV